MSINEPFDGPGCWKAIFLQGPSGGFQVYEWAGNCSQLLSQMFGKVRQFLGFSCSKFGICVTGWQLRRSW